MEIAASTQALSYTDIAVVEATVSGVGIPGAITIPLGVREDVWRAQVAGIPAGTGRSVSAVARDMGGATLFYGQVDDVVIREGGTASVALVLYQVAPSRFANSAPVIDALTLSAATVEPSGAVTVGVRAHDPDAGDVLTRHWTATCGTLADPSAAETVWTAPGAAGACTIGVTVRDGRGAAVHADAAVVVAPSSRGGAVISAGPDLSPVIQSITLSPTPLAVGQPSRLNVAATDPDGQTLSYAWTSDCSGQFDDPRSAGPLFSLSALPANANCRFAVVVTDSVGGSTTGALSQQAGEAVVDVAPSVVWASQSLEHLNAGETAVLAVAAADPDGQALLFTWSSSDGVLDVPVSDAQTSQVRFTAPSVLPGTAMHVTATVTDTGGLSTSVTFAFNRAPVVTEIGAAPLPLAVERPARLSVSAADPSGDVLSFAWTSSCAGRFDDPLLAGPTFTLSTYPASESCSFTVAVANRAGDRTSATFVGRADHLPTVGPVTVMPPEFTVGDEVTLDLTATDADGDTLAYSWESSCAGAFASASTSHPTFTLSSLPAAGQCGFTVTVTDARGGASAGHGQGVVGSAPEISNMLVSSLPLMTGRVADLVVEATDADGDPMSYDWSSDCSGSFERASAANPSFTLMTVPDTRQCSFQVVVSDGRGGETVGVILAQAGPVTVDEGPVIDSVSQGWIVTDPGDSGDPLSVSAHDPEGSPLTYVWTAAEGTLSPAMTSPDGKTSTVLWTPPAAMPNRVMHVTLTVSDPGGLSTVVTFDFVPDGPCAYASDGEICDDGDPSSSGDVCRGRICVGTRP